ncbi:glycosyltransferase (plasmid) [Sphingobium sp. JS3065]|uniref:glycosyltransferase n=1 Tax=Sphingobium sp. JS3065 TaxID=2970925 RepID=UPI0022646616|nr:glycosyltransferase [Sphingobium sp. JS3065]UZW58058.1 glycosyltransferase [Sphingobium sp. JS3065]
MTESKQALFVMPSSLIGGAERVAFNLILLLLSSGWRVSLITMSRGRTPGWDQLEGDSNFRWTALEAKSDKVGMLAAVATVAQLSRRHNFSFVYSTHIHVNAMLSVLRRIRLLRTRALVARESTMIFMRKTKYPRILLHLLYRLYGDIDGLICQTTLMKSNLLKSVPHLRRVPMAVLPNPTDAEHIARCVVQGDDDTDNGPIDFVFCGRLIALKRPDLVIRAIARLDRESWRSAQFLGRGQENGLRALAVELGIADRVVFRGMVDNPYTVFARARVGVLASTVEGFPNVLLEMMAAGTGRIVSSLCTPAVLDLPGVDIVDPFDEERLAAALEAALKGARRTEMFQAYIAEERSVALFWDRIQHLLSTRDCAVAD